MPDMDPTAADQPQTVQAVPPKVDTSDNHEPTPLATQHPYLQVFGPDTGVFQYELPAASVTIGRSEHADIRLPHHTVSRIHAMVACHDGDYTLEDANSNYGTTVNKQKTERHVLRHGDSIQISVYVLQFRTHPALPGALAAAAQAKLLLRSEFSQLPSSMRLRFRRLDVDPKEIYRTGDTLRVGNGGLLIPTPVASGYNASLELHLFWPSHQSKRYLGEILGVFRKEAINWMCVKLHTVPKDIHKLIVAAAKPGEWVDVPAT
jgi:pSer/pThr/pTyr-binding forkhead associated (FHA) protein